MSIRNVISGFNVTGVYPVNRNALKLPEDPRENLAVTTGLAFIPLYSPKPKPREIQRVDSLTFSLDELQRFDIRYENGYDLLHDDRYNCWLEIYHPEETLLDGSFTPDSPGYAWRSSSLHISPPLSPISSTPDDDLAVSTAGVAEDHERSQKGIRGKAATAQSCKLLN